MTKIVLHSAELDSFVALHCLLDNCFQVYADFIGYLESLFYLLVKLKAVDRTIENVSLHEFQLFVALAPQ